MCLVSISSALIGIYYHLKSVCPVLSTPFLLFMLLSLVHQARHQNWGRNFAQDLEVLILNIQAACLVGFLTVTIVKCQSPRKTVHFAKYFGDTQADHIGDTMIILHLGIVILIGTI